MKRFLCIFLSILMLIPSLSLGETAPLEEVDESLEEGLESSEEEEDEGIPVPLEDDLTETVPIASESQEEIEPAEEDPDDLPDEDDLEEEILDSREMKYGDEGDDVLELQTRLQELKYYTGNLSGRYREGTREAVKSFQGDYGLEKTGIADFATQNRLFAAKYRSLRYGASGEEVKALQTRLMELGYYKGKISGNFLGGTQKSIREFQEKSGLPVTGAADPLTQEALFAPGAVGNGDSPDATNTPVPDLNSFLVDDNDTAANNGVVMPDNYVPYTKTLKSGSSGALVKQLQQRMTDLGYYAGPVSGNFAKQTLRAVKAIQVQNGMKETGQVDEDTWNVIFNDRYIVMPDATPKPTPTPTPVPFAITVDVTNQVTTVYGRDEHGEYTVPVRRMICSTGTKANPSDVGDWVLNGRHAKWCVFPKWGNSYARYWTRINASIAFHSVIYTAVSLDAMKTSSYKALGTRASHGCIRLTVEDAKWVYENIGAGTVVSIREDLPADPELRDALKLPNLKKGTSVPVETPVPTPEPDYDATQQPELGNRRLRKNSEGPEVFWVQTRLAELGFYTGYVGGKMLNGTVNAVKSFQKANGIYASGEVDQKTLDAMMAQPEPAETPVPESTPLPAEVVAVETIEPTATPAPENV
ncbi:MAG: peptidoglycan-binding protein [Clostridia bacterium]|nr:peptidoglycan-binding protein [Clostridia bacterium]